VSDIRFEGVQTVGERSYGTVKVFLSAIRCEVVQTVGGRSYGRVKVLCLIYGVRYFKLWADGATLE
jgi:hypothetical protein